MDVDARIVTARRVVLRRGQTWETYDLTTGEPCPAVVHVEDAQPGRVCLLVEAGVGIRILDCAASALDRRASCTSLSSSVPVP